jgi:hypothetical protein
MYVRSRKAYAVLTILNLYLEYIIEVRWVTGAYPLRATNYLTNQLDTFLRATTEDELYQTILRRARLDGVAQDRAMFVESAPTTVRTPVVPTSLLGPGHSSSRGYTTSADGLRSAAAVRVTAAATPLTFTPDQFTARAPRTIYEALSGPDSAYWIISNVLRNSFPSMN